MPFRDKLVLSLVYKWLKDNDFLKAAIALQKSVKKTIDVHAGPSLEDHLNLLARAAELLAGFSLESTATAAKSQIAAVPAKTKRKRKISESKTSEKPGLEQKAAAVSGKDTKSSQVEPKVKKALDEETEHALMNIFNRVEGAVTSNDVPHGPVKSKLPEAPLPAPLAMTKDEASFTSDSDSDSECLPNLIGKLANGTGFPVPKSIFPAKADVGESKKQGREASKEVSLWMKSQVPDPAEEREALQLDETKKKKKKKKSKAPVDDSEQAVPESSDPQPSEGDASPKKKKKQKQGHRVRDDADVPVRQDEVERPKKKGKKLLTLAHDSTLIINGNPPSKSHKGIRDKGM